MMHVSLDDNHETPSSAGNLEDVAVILERFLCPGGKLRLSPYVEATQCLALLGVQPDPRHHTPSLRELIDQPAHAATLDAIAQRMLQSSSVDFGNTSFAHRGFLDFYLAHYFPANLGKLQLVLLDLLRAGQFPEKLHLIDLGVGPGTSFVAVLDFVLALGAVADLVGTALPLQELSLRGYDRSQPCLEYTREVLDAMGRILLAYRPPLSRLRGFSAGPALTLAWELVAKALTDGQVRQADIGGTDHVEFAKPSLVVLSYVLNELREQGRVEAFEARFAGLPEGSLLIVLEPGEEERATQLMRWRKSLVQRIPRFHPVLPCGQEFGVRLPAACDRCWCARREDIHCSPLQRAYLDRLDLHLRDCAPERRRKIHRAFERLSWSYCVLAARPAEEWREPARNISSWPSGTSANDGATGPAPCQWPRRRTRQAWFRNVAGWPSARRGSSRTRMPAKTRPWCKSRERYCPLFDSASWSCSKTWTLERTPPRSSSP